MYKLIAVDLDGTLLNSEHQLSGRNRQAILDVVDAGVIFSLSTGRPLQGVAAIIDIFDADLPFTIYNGAMIITSRSNEILFESELDGGLAEEVVRLGQARGTSILLYKDGALYVSEINDTVKRYTSVVGVVPNVPDDLAKFAAQGVTKIVWRDKPARIATLQDEVRPYVEGRINCSSSHPTLLEFFDINSSKGAAMRRIGDIYDIAQSEMMAIGDAYNDISMIEYAALGIAMGNAPQEIKDLADAVTLTNNEDGVAEAIYRFVL